MSTTTEGFVEVGSGRTWYRITRGDRVSDDAVPLLMLHGGPGGASPDPGHVVRRVAEDRAVIVYDQLDCGRSDRVSDPARWTPDALVEELARVRNALDLDVVHLWGQSWGGMLAMSYLLTRPSGVRSLTLASAPFSSPMWLDHAWRLRADLPVRTQRALARCEATIAERPPPKLPKRGPGPSSAKVTTAGKAMARLLPVLTSSPVQRLAAAASRLPRLRPASYQVVSLELVRRHVCRAISPPPELCAAMAGMNRAMYGTMWGPSEFFATGPIGSYDVRHRLAEIDVPTLVTSGAHEFASPEQMRILTDTLPDAEWELFEKSAHCAEFEEQERYAGVLTAFLTKVEAAYRM